LHSIVVRTYNVITMRLALTKIGNSRGIRIPKPLISQFDFRDDVELRVLPEGLMIVPRHNPRQNWKQSFSAGASTKKELSLMSSFSNAFDGEEWKW
jgi:antitoxin MazE